MLEYLHHPVPRMVIMTDELVRESIRSAGPWVALDVERLWWTGDGSPIHWAGALRFG